MNPKKEQVDHPSHYNQGGIECIDAMVSAFGKAKVFDFCHLNAFKYLWRVGRKDSVLQDLRKAKWYIEKAISLLEEPEAKVTPCDWQERSHDAD